MNLLASQSAPWWLRVQLWGLDAPVAALCWALAYARFMDINMMTSGPLLLLAAAVWVLTMAERLFRAVVTRDGWYIHFYRARLGTILMLLAAVAAAALWMLFFHVGRCLIPYACNALAFLLLGWLPVLRRSEYVRGFCQASAFALACSIPAAFYSVLTMPLELLFFAPTWYLAILMLLYHLLRGSWRMAEDAARRRDLLVSLGLVPLFCFCMLSANMAPGVERSLSLSIGIGAACLELLVRLRTRLSQDALFSLGWLGMALPPVLGMLLFAN